MTNTTHLNPAPVAAIEPITVTIAGAMAMTGWSRTEVYRLLKEEEIEAIKDGPSGASTLILVTSIRNRIASRPRAVFGQRGAKPASVE